MENAKRPMFTTDTVYGAVEVYFYHEGVVHAPTGNTHWVSTRCLVRFSSQTVFYGVAAVSPQDNFCKDTGRKIALRRAIAELPRDVRSQIWSAYRAKRGKW